MFELDLSEIFYVLALSSVSLTRVLIACLLSTTIAIIVSYVAISSRRNEKLFLGILDILQSIPVLSFVPGVMIFLSKLGSVGIEFSAIILIITGTLWNLIFSYYSSLKSIPNYISDLANVLKLGPIGRFAVVDFPYSLPQLVWNLILSFGGGWYFITYCEIFAIGELKHSVIGIGSLIVESAEKGENKYVLLGLLSIIIMITITFLLIWFPLMKFSERFKFEETANKGISSPSLIGDKELSELFDSLYKRILAVSNRLDKTFSKLALIIPDIIFITVVATIGAIILYVSLELRELSLREVADVSLSLIPSVFRVTLGVLISGAIAVPLGIAFGLSKSNYARIQPFVQILSSLPAPAFVPLIYPLLMKYEWGMFASSIIVIVMSSIWYIFYNTVAGVFSIPFDVFEVAKVVNMTRYKKLRTIILPSASKDIFVGFLTAWGGAWNGSFVAEYLHIGDEEFYLYGIGSYISKSAVEGNVPVLVFSTLLMASFVFVTNVTIWQRLIRKTTKRLRL